MPFWSMAHAKQKKQEGVVRRSNEQARASQAQAAAASKAASDDVKRTKEQQRRTRAGKRSKTVYTTALGLSEQSRSGMNLKQLTGQ